MKKSVSTGATNDRSAAAASRIQGTQANTAAPARQAVAPPAPSPPHALVDREPKPPTAISPAPAANGSGQTTSTEKPAPSTTAPRSNGPARSSGTHRRPEVNSGERTETASRRSGTHPRPKAAENPTADADNPSESGDLVVCGCGAKLRVPERRRTEIPCPICGTRIATATRPARSQAIEHKELKRDHFTKAAETFRQQLESQPPDTRKTTLGRFRYDRLKRTITGRLKGVPLDERKAAIAELGDSADPRAFDLLVPFLADEFETQGFRDDVVAALGGCGNPRAIPLLLPMLDATSARVQTLALTAIGRIGDRRTIRLILQFGMDHPHHKYIGSDAVVKMGEPAVLELLDILNDSDPGMVLEAVVLLGRLANAKAVPAVIQVAETRSSLFRAHAAEALGAIGDRRAVGTLIELLRDENAAVRVNAAAALAKIPDPKSVKPLLACLEDPDEDVTLHAIEALGEIGDPRAAEAIRHFLAGASTAHRVAAAETLGRLGDELAVGPLLDLVRSEDEATKLKAIGALRRIRSPQAVSALLPLLFHANEVVRQRVIDTLGQIGDSAVARQIEYYLKADRSEIVRAAAAKALGDLKDAESVDPLVDALQDVFSVKCRAIVSLGLLHQNSALAAIISMLRDPMSEARFHACGAMAELAPSNAVGLIEPLLDDPNAMVRRGAAKALQKLGDSRGSQLLDEALEGKTRRSWKKQMSSARGALLPLMPSALMHFLWPRSWARAGAAAGGVAAVVLLVFLIPKLLSGPSAPVRRGFVGTVTLSQDGKRVAVGRTGGMLEIYEAATGKLLDSNQGGSALIAFGPDDELILEAGTGLRFWKLKSEDAPSEKVVGHQKPIMRLQTTADRRYASTLDTDGVLVVWDLAARKPTGALAVPIKQFPASAISPDAKHVAAGNLSGAILIWDAATAEEITNLQVAKSAIKSIAYAPDGSLMCAATHDGTLYLIDPAKKSVRTTLKGPQGAMVKFTPDSQGLLTVRGRELALWNVADGANRSLPPVRASTLSTSTFSTDGKLLGVGSDEKTAAWLIDVASAKVVQTLDVK